MLYAKPARYLMLGSPPPHAARLTFETLAAFYQSTASEVLAVKFTLTPQQALMLQHLCRHDLTPRTSLEALASNVDTSMNRLRAKLKSHDIHISTRRGWGYLLTLENKIRLFHLLKVLPEQEIVQ